MSEVKISTYYKSLYKKVIVIIVHILETERYSKFS